MQNKRHSVYDVYIYSSVVQYMIVVFATMTVRTALFCFVAI